MTHSLRLYGALLKPWVAVVVYLWTLQLVFNFSANDPEPLVDRIADCAAILWTMIFWMALGSVFFWAMATAFVRGRPRIVLWNGGVAKVVLVLITAVSLIRWLFNWASLLGNLNLVFTVLILLASGLSLSVFWRRFQDQSRPRQLDLCLPSLNEAWLLFVMPVLIFSAASLALVVGRHGAVLQSNRAEVRSVPLQHAGAEQHRQLPNVILIVADALRPQSMSLYGYHRRTTPFLDQLAERSTVFTQAYTTSTSSRPSLTSVLSAKHPFSHGRLTKFLPAYDAPENLLRLLRQNGYTTAAVASNSDATLYLLGLWRDLVYGEYPNFRHLTLSWLRSHGVYPTNPGNRMYDELARFFPFLAFPEKALGFGSAESTLRIASDLVEQLREPFFLFIHLHEPHDPYLAPLPFRNKYASIDYSNVRRKIPAGFYSKYPPELQASVDVHRDHYDESIEYLDSELAKFMQRLRKNAKASNALLVLTADHGESFERGFLNHGEDLYETSVRVPLIIQFPGQDSGYRWGMAAQSTDIAPTILRAANIPIPSWADGIPLDGTDLGLKRYHVVVNYKDPDRRGIYNLPTKLAIIHRQKKLIVSCGDGGMELYDLADDPGELRNLAKEQVETLQTLTAQLRRQLVAQRMGHKMTCDFNSGF